MRQDGHGRRAGDDSPGQGIEPQGAALHPEVAGEPRFALVRDGAVTTVVCSSPTDKEIPMPEEVWFITGTSRGFGREWAIAALDRGTK